MLSLLSYPGSETLRARHAKPVSWAMLNFRVRVARANCNTSEAEALPNPWHESCVNPQKPMNRCKPLANRSMNHNFLPVQPRSQVCRLQHRPAAGRGFQEEALGFTVLGG